MAQDQQGKQFKALREAALLRNRIEGALRAASGPMAAQEITTWPSIVEITGESIKGRARTSYQLGRMVKEGFLEVFGKGSGTAYTWNKSKDPQPNSIPLPTTSTDLHVKVNKAQHTVSFVFQGLSITIEVQ